VAATWKSAEELLASDVQDADTEVDLGDAIGWEDLDGIQLVQKIGT
jgi:hypothetical protein